MTELTNEEKGKLRDWVMAQDSYLLVDRLTDVLVEQYRDGLETSKDDPRFYQGALYGVRMVKNALKAFGAPKVEYEASAEAFEHFRSGGRSSAGVY